MPAISHPASVFARHSAPPCLDRGKSLTISSNPYPLTLSLRFRGRTLCSSLADWATIEYQFATEPNLSSPRIGRSRTDARVPELAGRRIKSWSNSWLTVLTACLPTLSSTSRTSISINNSVQRVKLPCQTSLASTPKRHEHSTPRGLEGIPAGHIRAPARVRVRARSGTASMN